MQRGHKLAHPSAVGMPDGFDPSGIPCLDAGYTETPLFSSHRARAASLPGLAPAARLASVVEVESEGDPDWLIWGCIEGQPVLFTVEAGAAAEMMRAIARGELATAIVEPGQVVLERLD